MGQCLLIHLLILETRNPMSRKKIVAIYVFFIVYGCTIQLSFGQSNSNFTIPSLCREHNPCLYWDSTAQKDAVYNFYVELYELFSKSDIEKIKFQRDSLMLLANWSDTLFEKELDCYECMVDLFYKIYFEKQKKDHQDYFNKMNDSIELSIIYNSDTIKYNPQKMKVFCYLSDTTGRIFNKLRTASYSKGVLYPYSPAIYPTYAVLKYRKVYYDIGWIFAGDVVTVYISDYSSQSRHRRNQNCEGNIRVSHARNWSQFTQSISDIRKYSKENKINKCFKLSKAAARKCSTH